MAVAHGDHVEQFARAVVQLHFVGAIGARQHALHRGLELNQLVQPEVPRVVLEIARKQRVMGKIRVINRICAISANIFKLSRLYKGG